jgi:hypothetical protein
MWPILLTTFVAVAALLVLWYFKRPRPKPKPAPAAPPAPEEPAPPSGEPRPPAGAAARPRADVLFNLGSAVPITFSIDPLGEYMIVPCHKRQQLLFAVKSLEPGERTRPLRRYKMTDDTIIDCALVRGEGSALLAVAGLDRRKAVASFALDLAADRSAPGAFAGERAAAYDLQRIAAVRDGSLVAVLSDATYVRVYNAAGRQIFGRDTAQVRNTEIAVSADGELFAASSYTSDIVVYGVERDRAENCKKAVKAFTLGYHTNSAHTIDFARRSRLVATGGKDNTYAVAATPADWREGLDPRRRFTGKTDRGILLVRLAPVAETLAVLLEDGTIAFYRQDGLVKKLEQAVPATAKPEDVRMAWHPTEPWLFVMIVNAPYIYAYATP